MWRRVHTVIDPHEANEAEEQHERGEGFPRPRGGVGVEDTKLDLWGGKGKAVREGWRGKGGKRRSVS